MEMKRNKEFNQIISLLQELHSSYPQYNLGRHIATIMGEYGDVWGVTDKELLFALSKYKSQLDMDVTHKEDEDLDDIIRQAINLENILKEEDNGDY
jgi:hypothetical protein